MTAATRAYWVKKDKKYFNGKTHRSHTKKLYAPYKKYKLYLSQNIKVP
jgi:hypothetical protein